MELTNKKIGFAFTGSFCTYEVIFPVLSDICDMAEMVLPIMSFSSYNIDSRFGKAKEHIAKIEELTKSKIITTIEGAEPIGPKSLIDVLIIAPCTGNTIAKLANGITDTPVLMAAKGHLRNNKPVVIFLSSNDSLGNNLKNIGILLNSKNIFFVPFNQDNYVKKPNSMVSRPELIIPAAESALDNRQIQPIIV
ncbi:MAG: dipicolinate synthase subunit B [Lachnospiraceae bacterium]|nr:dipicolinate synthase subunit B [Lachnospiraceae bacterium]